MMLLITMSEWFGPSRYAQEEKSISGTKTISSDVRICGFITNLPLAAALHAINRYENDFNKKYQSVSSIEFTLVQVATIDSLSDEEIKISRARIVERLGETL